MQRSFEDLGVPLSETTFCVVDVETTGGSAADGAITEVGAVKLRGGECLGTLQTLVNPGMAIPPEITVLTGITEAMVLPALDQGKYTWKVQVNIGQRLGCGRHYVDAIAEKDGRKVLISSKWQQSGGTAEQKIPFEVMCLAEALEGGGYAKAYVVLGGEGWRLRQFYTTGGLSKYLRGTDNVEIVTLESFVAKANRGQL